MIIQQGSVGCFLYCAVKKRTYCSGVAWEQSLWFEWSGPFKWFIVSINDGIADDIERTELLKPYMAMMRDIPCNYYQPCTKTPGTFRKLWIDCGLRGHFGDHRFGHKWNMSPDERPKLREFLRITMARFHKELSR